MFTVANGTITSPNYPGNYPINRLCKSWISVASGSRLQLNFSEIDVENHLTCRYDYVKIYNGPDETAPLLGSYCSRHAPSSLISSSNKVLIVFKSDSSNTGRGFSVDYTSVAGGMLHIFFILIT